MLVFLLGCAGDEPKGDGPLDMAGPTNPSETGTTETDQVGTDTADTDPDPVDVEVSGLQWSLNEVVGSVIHARWTQDAQASVHVEYSFDEDVWLSSPSFDAGAGSQEQVLVGIPYGVEVQWRVAVDGGSTFDGPAATTAPIPADLPLPVLELSEPDAWSSGQFLLSSLKQEGPGWGEGTFWVFLLDRQGRVVWALLTPDRCLFPQVSATGDYLLWDQATYWSDFDGGEGSTIHYTWLDEEFDVVEAPGVHHPFVQHPDGTLAWTSRIHGGDEAVVEKAPGQLDETVVWTCGSDWPEGAGYNCHNNGMYYRPSTETYLLSFPLWSAVVEATRGGESLWYAGSWIDGGYDFEPYNQAFTWEHGVSFTDADTLLLSGNLGYSTWCLEYEVDTTTGALTFLWGSDSGVLLSNSGQCWRMEGGNTLHIVGDAGVIREVDAAGEDVWRLSYPNSNLLGQGQLIDDLYALVKPRD